MQNRLKVAFILFSFAATMLTVYAADSRAMNQSTVGGVDISDFSPRMLSISPNLKSAKKRPAAAASDTTSARMMDSLSQATTNY